WLQEQRAKAKTVGQPRLLALGDPAFTPVVKDKDLPAPPDHGVLVTQVQPQGNAAGAGVRRGDVLLTYDGAQLTALKDLAAAFQKASARPKGDQPDLPVTLWRRGKRLSLKLFPGPLGMAFSRQPAAEAIKAAREADALLA